MKQVIRRGLKEIIVDEVPDPFASRNHVLVRPFYSLISSGTETADIHKEGIFKEVAENPSHLKKVYDVMMKTNPIGTVREVRAKFSDYAVLGYAGAGVIVDKHESVTDLAIGQRVAYGGEGTGHGETLNIGRNLAARIPDNVPFEHACFTTLGAIAMNAVRQADIQVGDSVAVIGLGLVGQLVAQLVRCQGGIVIATDLQKSRIELARQTGADFVVAGGESAVAEVQSLTEGRGADIVIVAAASKSPAPVQTAIKMCRDRGRLVIVGIMPLEMPHGEMYMKELKLIMARAYGPGSYDANYEKRGQDYPISYVRWTENRNMEEFLRLLATKRIDVAPLVSHEFPLEEAPRAYDTIMDGKTDSLAVLLRYPANESANGLADFKPKRKVEINAPVSRLGKDELRFALVGAGNLVRWEHLPALQKIPNTKLQAVYSSRGAKGKGYGIRFKAEYTTSDYEDILSDREVDVVLVASRHREHAAQTVAALKSGKHVFVEKPMAISEQECREILRAVRESGKQVTVGFNRRFAPFYAEMKNQIAKRTGAAVINIRMNASYMTSDFWGATIEEGGAIIGEAVHMVDLMRFFLGCDPTSVSAYSLPTDKSEPIGENNIVASFKFEDGSIANLTYCTVGSDSSAGEFVEFFAPGIGASSEDFKQLVVKKGSSRKKQSKIWAAKGYDAQMQSFVKCLREGIAPEITALDGAKAFLGCQLMLESARNEGTPQIFDVERILPD
jgi:predicted dehydrogenase/threonine dehydrogenase-like Zn-dependent dehydrogenase